MRALTNTGASVGGDAALAKKPLLSALVMVATVTCALLFAYRGALASMVQLWNNSPMYSYGFTVPLVSAYLLWSRRNALRALTPRPSWAIGGIVLLTAMLMTIAGRVGGIQVLEQVALLVSLTAAVLLVFGVAYLRVGWAALAYLLLMVPLWDGLTEGLHEPFQQRSAAIGAWLLQTIGVPVHREGLVIALPNLTIEVARACSGVNYLVAVMALGLPLAYLYLPTVWRRLALLVAALVVAALSNGLRVAVIGLLAYLEVGSPLHGPFHVLHGLFVAGVGYVVLFVGLRLLTPQASSSASEPSISGEIAVPPVPSGSSRVLSAPAALTLAALFVIVGLNPFAVAAHSVVLETDLTAFPQQLGPWVSHAESLAVPSSAPAIWTGADAELRRRYTRADGAAADLYLGYFESQSQEKEVVTHRATELHGRAARRRLSMPDGRTFDVNYAHAGRDGVAMLFWYEAGRGPETNRFLVKARTLWSALWTGHTNAAVVVLMTKSEDPRDAEALQELAPFVEAAVAACLPRNRRPTGL